MRPIDFQFAGLTCKLWSTSKWWKCRDSHTILSVFCRYKALWLCLHMTWPKVEYGSAGHTLAFVFTKWPVIQVTTCVLAREARSLPRNLLTLYSVQSAQFKLFKCVHTYVSIIAWWCCRQHFCKPIPWCLSTAVSYFLSCQTSILVAAIKQWICSSFKYFPLTHKKLQALRHMRCPGRQGPH